MSLPLLPPSQSPTQLSPKLQELQQEVIASVRHDVLRNPGGKKNYHGEAGEWGGGVWKPGFLEGRGGRGNFLAFVDARRAEAPRHSRGGDDLILGSPDQQHRTLVPSGQQQGEKSSTRDR